jgi:hypothetical protein
VPYTENFASFKYDNGNCWFHFVNCYEPINFVTRIKHWYLLLRQGHDRNKSLSRKTIKWKYWNIVIYTWHGLICLFYFAIFLLSVPIKYFTAFINIFGQILQRILRPKRYVLHVIFIYKLFNKRYRVITKGFITSITNINTTFVYLIFFC